jgi:hypothetical protein
MQQINIIKPDILKRVAILPDELINIIHKYIPTTTLVWLTKQHYNSYHRYVIPKLLKIDRDSYMRHLLRNDFDILFNMQLRENAIKWKSSKKYIYKKKVYKNYFEFIWELSTENEATKCRNLILLLNT